MSINLFKLVNSLKKASFHVHEPDLVNDQEELALDENSALTNLVTGIQSGWQPTEFVGLGADSRTLFLTNEIEQNMASAFISQIQELADLDETLPVIVQINTPGGSATDMLAIYDVLRSVPCPIITVAVGLASSAGCILMQAGDLRVAMPNAQFFWHEAVTFVQPTSPDDFNSHIQSYKKVTKIIRKIVLDRTGMTKKKFRTHFANKTNFTFFAEEALELGWIDVIEAPLQKPVFRTYVELAEHLSVALAE